MTTTSRVSAPAALVRGAGEEFVVTDVDLDPLRPDEVRVRMVASGVCHTDAVVRDGLIPSRFPVVLGHEGAGVVEEVGPLVTHVAVGDHVVLGPPSCGVCRYCRLGEPTYCEAIMPLCFGGSRADGSVGFAVDGQEVGSHFFGQSSFASLSSCMASSVIPVAKDLPLEMLAPLGCGLQTGAGAVLKEMRPPPGSAFVVTGYGAVGAGAAMAAAIAGCETIIVADLHESRLELARELGATHTVLGGDPAELTDAIREATGGRGADAALDTTGVPALMLAMHQALATRGTLVLVAATAPDAELALPLQGAAGTGWSVRHVIEGSSVPPLFVPELVTYWRQGRFPFDRLITTYPLAEIEQAFADSHSGASIKPVVTFD